MDVIEIKTYEYDVFSSREATFFVNTVILLYGTNSAFIGAVWFKKDNTAALDPATKNAAGVVHALLQLRRPAGDHCGRTREHSSVPYLNRSRIRRGMVTPAVVRAFRSIGWGWGGSWAGSTKDYMHFSSSGY